MKTIKQIRKALLLITLAIQSLILSINPANADVMTGVNAWASCLLAKPRRELCFCSPVQSV